MKNSAATLGLLCAVLAAGPAYAQVPSNCSSPQPPSIGAAIGRSDPWLELEPGTFDALPGASVAVRSGTQLTARADLPVAGPLRLRVEGSTVRWDVRQTTYDADAGFRAIDETSIGHVTARHLAALIGVRLGHPSVCAHVSAGGGLYSMGFPEAAIRRPGFTIAAGVEIPTGARGAVQLDVALHLVGTRDSRPIAMSTIPVASLLVGWAYRF